MKVLLKNEHYTWIEVYSICDEKGVPETKFHANKKDADHLLADYEEPEGLTVRPFTLEVHHGDLDGLT